MITPRRRRIRAGFALALTTLSLCLSITVLLQPIPLRFAQERVFDRMLMLEPSATDPDRADSGPPVRVVDIGAFDEIGLPWSRAATARLTRALTKAKARVIAFDVVFSGDCDDNPVNRALAEAIRGTPVILGFLLSGTGTLPPGPGIGPDTGPGAQGLMWRAPGVEAACPMFGTIAQASAAVALVGDRDGIVRRVPVAVGAAGRLYPTLAVAAVAVAQGTLSLTDDGKMTVGRQTLPLEPGGTVRFRPSRPESWPARTLAAESVLRGDGAGDLAGAVVFVGSSLPSRGGLRATAASPVQPSVQIAADMAQGLLARTLPRRPPAAPLAEAGAVLIGGAAVLLALARLAALPALGLAGGLVAVWVAFCGFALRGFGLLFDPAFPSAAVLGTAVLALALRAVASGRAEAALRARMGQLLPPAVVTRLAEEPGLLRLKGEARVVTALSTDIAGFSLATRRLGPEALVAMLDGYFEETCGIVLRHGGMIDKIVGDSVIALFNAPLDQPGHVDAAIACAAEIIAATERLRARPDMAAAGLGATRVGLETGPAILGDVGSGARIDYTAYGDAVNLASRLQDMNKGLGTQICVGPGAAAAALLPLRTLGQHEVRSFGMLALYSTAEA